MPHYSLRSCLHLWHFAAELIFFSAISAMYFLVQYLKQRSHLYTVELIFSLR